MRAIDRLLPLKLSFQFSGNCNDKLVNHEYGTRQFKKANKLLIRDDKMVVVKWAFQNYVLDQWNNNYVQNGLK